MSAERGAVRSLAVLGGGTALAALLGLGFQSLLAYWFGAGRETDAFFMSLSIYGFLVKLLMLTHLRALALPIYARVRRDDPGAAARFAGSLLGLTTVGTLLLGVAFVAGAPLLVDLLAPGYEGPMRDLTTDLVRVRVLALPFLAATTLSMAWLEAEGRFGVSVSAQKVVPAAVALVLLAAAADRLGIVAVAWFGLLGTVAATAFLIPVLRRLVGSLGPGPALRDPEVRGIGGHWLRLSGSNAATFVGEWAFRIGASLLPVGLFSAVLYGRMVHDLMHATVNDSAQTVALPRFAKVVAEPVPPGAPADVSGARLGKAVCEALGSLAAVSLPLGLLAATTAPWIVALLFGRGRFLEDGMLGPAAASLALFMVGFFLQGLVQLLFAGAFAAHRIDLVNRVQIVGHLVRAAALVPMVRAFSHVGLVGSQVAMNALVLALLVATAPRAWGLGVRVGGVLRPFAVALVPAVLYLAVVEPRLPDPLAVGTLARAAVLSGVGGAWLLLHLGLVLAFGLPGAPVVRRYLGRAPSAALLVVALLAPAPAHAQQAGPGPLPEGSRYFGVLEWLEARGRVPAGAVGARPVAAATVGGWLDEAGRSGDAAAALAAGAWTRLLVERGTDGLVADWLALGLSIGGRDPPGEGTAALRLDLGRVGALPYGFLHLDAGEDTPLARGGVGVRGGRAWASLGRERVRLGGGATGSIVLNPGVALDGIMAGTSRPFAVPVLGDASVVGGIGRMGRYEAVDDPWWAFVRVTTSPAAWLQLGYSRALLAGGRFEGGSVPYDPVEYGPDRGGPSALDLAKIAIGVTTQFDDQVAAVDVRASTAALGVPALAYAEVGWEDASRSWGDPALIAGLLLAPGRPFPWSVRYEYVAFGRDARICAWCDTLPAYWYQHTRFQSGWRVGDDLLGHPLGGYGRQHALVLAGWAPDGSFEGSLLLGRVRRDRWNLLEAARPGSATRWELTADGWLARRTKLVGRWSGETGDGWRWRRASVALQAFF